MSDVILKLPDDAANNGRNVDLEQLIVSGNTVVRERIQIAGASAAEILRIKGTIPLSTDMGMVTRPIGAADSGGSDMTDPAVHALKVAIAGGALIPGALGANGGLKVDIVGDVGVASTLDTDDGSVAAAQPNVALVINLRYRWNGSAWVRGGWTPHGLVSANTTNGTSVKASPGTIGSIAVGNVNASQRYLKLYNKAAAPTVGTDVPVHTLVIPGNASGAGSNIPLPDGGLAFSTGIAYALTTGPTTADTGVVGANEITVNIGWL